MSKFHLSCKNWLLIYKCKKKTIKHSFWKWRNHFFKHALKKKVDLSSVLQIECVLSVHDKQAALNLIFVSFNSTWIIWLYHICTSQYKHLLLLFPSKHALPIPSERECKMVSDIDFWAKQRAAFFFSCIETESCHHLCMKYVTGQQVHVAEKKSIYDEALAWQTGTHTSTHESTKSSDAYYTNTRPVFTLQLHFSFWIQVWQKLYYQSSQ